MTSKLVTNKQLHTTAIQKELHTFIINEPYNENKWNPPLYIDKQHTEKTISLSIKTIADGVESAIGLYVIKNGEIGSV